MQLVPAVCYRALSSRDRRFDGRFFVGVTSTGVYCRPICPARTPARKNVRFYPCAAAAEADGFRPCRRCRPDTAPGTPAWHGAPTTVARGLRLIRDGALDEGGMDRFAARLGLSARQVSRLFETHVGASPADIARTRRVHFARALMDSSAMRLTDIAFAAGFQSVRQFNYAFRQTFHGAPRDLRRRATTRAGDAVAGASGDTAGVTLTLHYRPPLDAAWLLALFRARAAPGVEVVAHGAYHRTAQIEDATGWFAVTPAPGHGVRVTVSPSLNAHVLRVASGVRRLFDLDADPATIEAALARDPRLVVAVRQRPGLRVPGAWQIWEIAARAIAGQQVSVAAATTLVGRLVARVGVPVATPLPALTHLFPSPAATAAADLSHIGMPAARVATLQRVAAGLADGRIRLEPDVDADATVRALCTIPGVGPWTAEYIALRALGEPDAFPAGDLGIRKALGDGAMPATEKRALEVSEAWRPWRGYAAMHLWQMKTED